MFIAKLSIVVEEADESIFWLDLLLSIDKLNDNQVINAKKLLKESKELTSIFIATRKTMMLKKQNRK